MRFLTIAILLLVTSCASTIDPPELAPEYFDPPEVATSGFETTVVEAVVPLGVSDFRAWLLDNPLIDFLEPTGSISAPESGEILKGEWLDVGAVRRLRLEDGHYTIERILENRPELFSYQIWVFTNNAARGVDQIVGEQRFIPVDASRTKFEWTYNIKPKSALTRIFVRRGQAELETFMSSGVNAMAAEARRFAASKN